MFWFAILIGIYSYLIFTLGILGVLYKEIILLVSIIYFIFIVLLKRKFLNENVSKYFKAFKQIQIINNLKQSKFLIIILSLIVIQGIINFIGALGPEHAFDALWYHLTLPKIYLLNHKIEFIPGGLLYYSAMPQFTEMLYAASLAVKDEILAKIIHFSFGILSTIVLYKLSRRYLSMTFSLLGVLIFYSNLVVAWESITAYIDLSRTFFEVTALLMIVNWIEEKNKKWLAISAVMVGIAISTKLLALGSLAVFCILIIFYSLKFNRSFKNLFINLFLYIFISLLIPLPWFIFSFINTGNPFYPFFTPMYETKFDFQLLNPFRFFSDLWNLFIHADDPLSPIYIIVFPLIVILIKNLKKFYPLIFYSFLALLIWYVTPRTGGGRFIVPYLPAFSILVTAVITLIPKDQKVIKAIIISIVLLISTISIVYRGVANSRYINVISGKETKDKFLAKHLNFHFGDFYDIDGYFKKNIHAKDSVLLYGFHNLYYVNFPFIHESFVKEGDYFNYVAIQEGNIPQKFNGWNLVYQSTKTNIKVYSKNAKPQAK